MEGLTSRLNLGDDRRWRSALLVVFCLAVACRFLVYTDMGSHPVGEVETWSHTDAWFFTQLAMDTASGDWLMQGVNLHVTPEMRRLASPEDWRSWSGNRLPRGAAVVYIAATGYSITGRMDIYKLLSILAGGLLCVAIAAATAGLFRHRPAGLVAGIVASSQQSLVLMSIIPGAWQWEALVLAAWLAVMTMLRDGARGLAHWVLLGLLVAFGLWLRTFFAWLLVLTPLAMWRWGLFRESGFVSGCALAAAPVLAAVALLTVRNIAADARPWAFPGQPAWDFAGTMHPDAVLREVPPREMLVMEAARGRLRKAVPLTLSSSSSGVPEVLGRKLRELLGARDEARTINYDYVARRSEMLRTISLRPDVTMALAWAALLFLALNRRLPRLFFYTSALVLIHGLLFRTGAEERTLIHALACMMGGAGLVVAAGQLPRRPVAAFAFLALWALMNVVLQVDDQARGSRYRPYEFSRAAQTLRASGQEARAALEAEDYRQVRRRESVLGSYWYMR